MMNILFITTQFPYPLDNGGKVGALNGISVLSVDNKLTVLSFSEDKNTVEGLKYYQKKMPDVKFMEPIYHHIHIRKRYLELCKVMVNVYLRGIPYIMMKFYDKRMFCLIDQCMKTETYDMVFIDYLNMVLYGNYIKKKHKGNYKYFVFKDHNIEADIFRQEKEKSFGIRKIIMGHEEKSTRKYEIDAVQNSDLVFTVCDEDRDVLRKFSNKVFSMKPVFEIKPFREELTDKNKLLYIGNLSWKANIDGLKWFFENVWHDLKKKVPDVELDIIGSGIKESPFGEIQGVNYIGYVKELEEIYKDYKVFIVPLFEGSGIRIKILEAFNNDIAVVATSVACGTIGVKNEREILIADSSKEFLEAIVRVISDEQYNIEMKKKAKSYMKNNFELVHRRKEIKKIIDGMVKYEN